MCFTFPRERFKYSCGKIFLRKEMDYIEIKNSVKSYSSRYAGQLESKAQWAKNGRG